MKKPARAGKRILTLDDLVNAAYERRSIINRHGNRRLPAAVMVSMQGLQIARYIMDGIWIYKPKRRIDLSKPPKAWTPRKPAAPVKPAPILNLPYYP
jgi:hypothetical protein